MDLICWSSRGYGDFETAELTEALAKLFRLSLNKGSEIITVEREIEHVQSYIAIQRKRYEDQISFKLTLQDGLKNYHTLKMILQPLVENAIYHGIEKNGGTGNIVIEGYQQDDFLVFSISDDGVGAGVDELTSLLENATGSNAIAIRNINDRIKLHFGEEYGLFFSNNDKGGLTVYIYQPICVKGKSDAKTDNC